MRMLPLARAVLALAAVQVCVCAQPQITLAVFNLAGAPHWEVRFAVETAHRAFQASRIETRWVICGPKACQPEPPVGQYVELFLMPRLRGPISGGATTHPAGYAMPTGFARPRAYAFYDAARTVAQRTMRPEYLVLSCILIHETGHLLGLHHQPHGAMRANLEGADMDYTAMGRAFDSEQQKQLVAALSRFTALAPPGASPPVSQSTPDLETVALSRSR